MATEKAAQKLWCPLSFNSGLKLCCASECMGWRWSRAKETKSYLDAVRAHMAAHKMDFAKAANEVYADRGSTFEKVEGYCGQFGKPE